MGNGCIFLIAYCLDLSIDQDLRRDTTYSRVNGQEPLHMAVRNEKFA